VVRRIAWVTTRSHLVTVKVVAESRPAPIADRDCHRRAISTYMVYCTRGPLRHICQKHVPVHEDTSR